MANETLDKERELVGKLQFLLLDLAVDYTIVAKKSSPNKSKPKRVSKKWKAYRIGCALNVVCNNAVRQRQN